MSNTVKTILWIIAIFGGIYLLSNSGESSSSYPSAYPSSYGSEDGYENEYDQDNIPLSYDDAIYDYWDEIQDYANGTAEIEACSDSSGNCYDLEAEISDGCIEEIYFENGGYLYFSYACIDDYGSAYDTDEEGNDWTFEIDMDSSIITDAVNDWAYDNNYVIE